LIPSDSIEIRNYRPDNDKAFIYSTWLRNYKHSSYFAKRIKPVIFFAGHHPIVEHLLGKSNSKIFIACPKGDADTILGYLVCEKPEDKNPIVHFIFMKEAFRGMGIGKALFKHAAIDPNKMNFTHWTLLVDDFIRKWPEMIYDPYKL